MRRPAFCALLLLGLVACDEPVNTAASQASTTTSTTEATATTTSVTTTTATTSLPWTTLPTEAFLIAEEEGVTPEEAAEILYRQALQSEALQRLSDLVGEDVILGAAFDSDFLRADEITVFVVDEGAVAHVNDHLVEAGFDVAKTTVAVGAEEQPEGPWDWLEEEPYTDHEWLESPGPHLFGAWALVESNREKPEVPVIVGFVSGVWGAASCPVDLGRYMTSVESRVTLTVDRPDVDCEQATKALERLVLTPIKEADGAFDLRFEGDKMIWTGQASELVFEPDDSIGLPPGEPWGSEHALEVWNQTVGPQMEGIWRLLQVVGEDPSAPVSLFVGVSTLDFETGCNSMRGTFALSSEGRMATHLFQTEAGCRDARGDVEEQMDRFFTGAHLIEVVVDRDTMTWRNPSDHEIVWVR